MTGWVPTLLRAGRGMVRYAGAQREAPPQLLQLWDYDGNQFSRLVRGMPVDALQAHAARGLSWDLPVIPGEVHEAVPLCFPCLRCCPSHSKARLLWPAADLSTFGHCLIGDTGSAAPAAEMLLLSDVCTALPRAPPCRQHLVDCLHLDMHASGPFELQRGCTQTDASRSCRRAKLCHAMP